MTVAALFSSERVWEQVTSYCVQLIKPRTGEWDGGMEGLVSGVDGEEAGTLLLCSFSNYTMSEALVVDCEPSKSTQQEVGRGRRCQQGYSASRSEREAKKETSRWGFC